MLEKSDKVRLIPFVDFELKVSNILLQFVFFGGIGKMVGLKHDVKSGYWMHFYN